MIARLRQTNVCSYWLALVLAALVLRALIPTGFAVDADTGFTFTSAMCSLNGAGTETSEIPTDTSAAPHCVFCVPAIVVTPELTFQGSLFSLVFDAPAASFTSVVIAPLSRAPSARAPPLSA